MHLLIVGKFPPMQGGVSSATFWAVRQLVDAGHRVTVLTNAEETEIGYRELMLEEDRSRRSPLKHDALLRIVNTRPIDDQAYIPFANPFVTKLFGAGARAIAEEMPDMIVGWYLEPYGIVASMLGSSFQIPYGLSHAGSDIGRLASHCDLRAAYRRIIREAEFVFTGGIPLVRETLSNLGLMETQIRHAYAVRLPSAFREGKETLDLDAYVRSSRRHFRHHIDGFDQLVRHWNGTSVPDRVPVIGVYGKIGRTKGTLSLLQALERLAADRIEFVFAPIPCAPKPMLKKYFELLAGMKNLLPLTRVLAPMPPWRIPGYLRRCDVICYLENDFPIPFHTPQIPREILASGRCLVCAGEVVQKLPFGKNLVDGANYVCCDNPGNIDQLADRLRPMLTDEVRRNSIRKHGKALGDYFEYHCDPTHWLTQLADADGSQAIPAKAIPA